MPHRARALLGGTIALGAMTVLVASFRTDSGSLRMLAVLAAAAALSELFTIPADRGSLHPLDAHGFSLSASVHVAAILILGPLPPTRSRACRSTRSPTTQACSLWPP